MRYEKLEKRQLRTAAGYFINFMRLQLSNITREHGAKVRRLEAAGRRVALNKSGRADSSTPPKAEVTSHFTPPLTQN